MRQGIAHFMQHFMHIKHAAKLHIITENAL